VRQLLRHRSTARSRKFTVRPLIPHTSCTTCACTRDYVNVRLSLFLHHIPPNTRQPSIPMEWRCIALFSCGDFFKTSCQSQSHFRSLPPLRHPRILQTAHYPRLRHRSYLRLRPEALPTKPRLPPVRSPFANTGRGLADLSEESVEYNDEVGDRSIVYDMVDCVDTVSVLNPKVSVIGNDLEYEKALSEGFPPCKSHVERLSSPTPRLNDFPARTFCGFLIRFTIHVSQYNTSPFQFPRLCRQTLLNATTSALHPARVKVLMTMQVCR